MSAGRQLLNFIVEKDLLDRVDDFRFLNRFPTRAGAIKWLLNWALEQGANPALALSQAFTTRKRTPRPGRGRIGAPAAEK